MALVENDFSFTAKKSEAMLCVPKKSAAAAAAGRLLVVQQKSERKYCNASLKEIPRNRK